MELPENPDLLPALQEVRARLRYAVGEPAYSLWLSSLVLTDWDGRVLRLTTSDGKHRWIAKRFAGIVQRTASSVIGREVQVEFVGPAPGSRSVERHESVVAPQPPFNPRYTFDQFVIGESNRLAHAAALAVAESPGQAYNPLFLYAPPGLGKTHLLHAIGNYLKSFGPHSSVRYTTAETFTNHFLNALGSRSIDRFKHAYRSADVLLIDDIQFLASKARTEEEFFHTFNALYERGRQLVVSCDRLPEQLTAVEQRLRERFEAGLVAEICPPDFDTRRTILRKRAQIDGVALADREVLDVVASRVTTNVRALEGALVRIVAFNSLTARPIDRELAATVLNEIHPRPTRDAKPSIQDIQNAVAFHFGLSVKELVSPARSARLALPRQMAMYLARELASCSLIEIGAAFGGRNHTTVVHACAQVRKRATHDETFKAKLSAVREAITAHETDRSC
ncbi:MAG: chromosomal replication initiator protein DnaA [Solirubrobacterales bacterium]|nr:chromosomal replication initiator protein DnaA [Solirubrobacterales bacterium]